MKQFAFLIFTSFSGLIVGQTSMPFEVLKFDKVVMYDFTNSEVKTDLYIVRSDGELSNSVIREIKLTLKEIKKLNRKIDSRKSYGELTEACFDAHLGFVYFLENKIVAHITVSLACYRLHSSIDIPAQQQGKVMLGTDTYYTATGMSKSFKKFLNSMLIRYNFSHQFHIL